MNKTIYLLVICASIIWLNGCKKPDPSPAPSAPFAPGTVLSSEANVVIVPTFATMAKDAASLYSGAVTFQTAPTSQNLNNCRQLWLNVVADYEQSSALLFGPGASIGADPSSIINTYPIDTLAITAMVNSSAVFIPSYIDSLPSYLIGFHGIEFELYSITGNKTAAQFTPHQLSYITAVALNIQTLTEQMDSVWSNSYYSQFVNAGNGSTVYPDQRAAFSDLVMAIANICETDAIYKFNAIIVNKSTILQESPFANNSITDIQNNLIGVKNVYYGQYGTATGTGLSTFVIQYNPNLDTKIKNDINAAIGAVNLVTAPLSQAIYTQPSQVNLAKNLCDSLSDDLKNNLLIYTNTYSN